MKPKGLKVASSTVSAPPALASHRGPCQGLHPAGKPSPDRLKRPRPAGHPVPKQTVQTTRARFTLNFCGQDDTCCSTGGPELRWPTHSLEHLLTSGPAPGSEGALAAGPELSHAHPHWPGHHFGHSCQRQSRGSPGARPPGQLQLTSRGALPTSTAPCPPPRPCPLCTSPAASRVQVTRSLGVPWTRQSTTHPAGVTTRSWPLHQSRSPSTDSGTRESAHLRSGPAQAGADLSRGDAAPRCVSTCPLLRPAACHNGSCGPESPDVQENKVNMPPPSPNSFSQLFLPTTSLPLHTTEVAKRPPVHGVPCRVQGIFCSRHPWVLGVDPVIPRDLGPPRGLQQHLAFSVRHTNAGSRRPQPSPSLRLSIRQVDDTASSMSAWP